MAEPKREQIAAIVVTYNRKSLLARCLDALLGQSHRLDALYVIDNHSTDGTYEDLVARDWIAPLSISEATASESVKVVPRTRRGNEFVEIRYVRMPENTGGAGGFHEGIRRGAEAGFDWLWLMDDDLLPAPDALEALIARKESLAETSVRPFLLNCLVLSANHADDDTLAFPLQEISEKGHPRLGVYHWHLSETAGKTHQGLYRWACPFNGTFVPARVVAEVGLPNKDFFLKGDEKDFLWRAARKFDFYTVMESKAHHPKPGVDAFDWKQYYHIRNMFVVNAHFNFRRLRNLKLILTSLMLGARHGKGGTKLVLQAIRDGLAGRLGKRDDVHTWLDG